MRLGPTPLDCSRYLSCSVPRAFVSMSANWSNVEIYLTIMTSRATFSWIKCWRMLTCLALALYPALLASRIVPWLASQINVALAYSWQRSLSIARNHSTSWLHRLRATYSASDEVKATVRWYLDLKMTGAPPIITIVPNTDRLSSYYFSSLRLWTL